MPLYQQHSISSVFHFLFSVSMKFLKAFWKLFLVGVFVFAKVIELIAKAVSLFADEILKVSQSQNAE